MKKVSFLPLIMGTVLCFCIFAANAQSDRKYNREMEKVYKKKATELKKEGWKATGSSLSLEASIMKHLRTLNSDDKNREIISNVSMCKALNVCSAQALNNALVRYAENAGSYVRGRVMSDLLTTLPEIFPKSSTSFMPLTNVWSVPK